jgi:hypothetical protein
MSAGIGFSLSKERKHLLKPRAVSHSTPGFRELLVMLENGENIHLKKGISRPARSNQSMIVDKCLTYGHVIND